MVNIGSMRKAKLELLLLMAAAFLYVGADWQTEVCIYNICNGWEPYAWICCLWQISSWAAFDFWRLIRYVIVGYLLAEVAYNKLRRVDK